MLRGKYYSSIVQLPVANWRLAASENNLEHLIIEGKVSESKLVKAWNKIEEEIITERIKDRDYVKKLKAEAAFALQMIRAMETGNAALRHRIKLELEARKRKNDKEVEADILDVLEYLERVRGVILDENTLTVAKFLNYLKNAKKMQPRAEKPQRNGRRADR